MDILVILSSFLSLCTLLVPNRAPCTALSKSSPTMILDLPPTDLLGAPCLVSATAIASLNPVFLRIIPSPTDPRSTSFTTEGSTPPDQLSVVLNLLSYVKLSDFSPSGKRWALSQNLRPDLDLDPDPANAREARGECAVAQQKRGPGLAPLLSTIGGFHVFRVRYCNKHQTLQHPQNGSSSLSSSTSSHCSVRSRRHARVWEAVGNRDRRSRVTHHRPSSPPTHLSSERIQCAIDLRDPS
ncbi:hypothetical protein H4582DRAFT_1293480 [Lactarius indigo]|nr:hypothetical protein H4582DRAFT_1293480 [Lactarius indigo]